MKIDNASCLHCHIPLAFSLAIALAGCDKFSQKTPLEHVQKAMEYRAQGDLPSSSIELKTALQQNPDLLLARQLLGEINLDIGDSEGAEKELSRALELGGKKIEIVPSLAKALLLQGKYQQVLDRINPSDVGDPTVRANLMVYRGDAFLATNKPDEARAQYEEVLANHADSVLAKVGLARLVAIQLDFDKALQLLQEVISSSPQEAKAYSLQGDIYKDRGENEKAEASYDKAIEYGSSSHRDRDRGRDRANRAIIRISMNKFDLAGEDLSVLKKEAPNFFLTRYAEGLLAFNQGKYPEAQESLAESLKANSQYLPTYYYLGVTNLQQNNLSQADEYLSKFIKAFPKSIETHKLLALAKFRLNDLKGAKDLLSPVLKQLPNDKFSQELMGSIDLAMGNQQEGIGHLNKLVDLQPDSAQAHMRLGQALVGQGAKERGIQELERSIQMDPKLLQADSTVILTYLRNHEFDKALTAAERLHTKLPDSPVPLNLIAGAYLGQGKQAEARAALDEALKVSPGDPDASHNLAVMEAKKGDFEKAASYYQQVLQHKPGHLVTLLRYAQLRQKQGKTADVKKLLEQATERNPKALQPRIMLADYYLQNGQPQQALAIAWELQQAHRNDPELLRVIGEAQLNAGEGAAAVSSLQKLAVLAPKSAHSYYLLAKAYAATSQPVKELEALDKVLSLDANHIPAQSIKTSLLIQDGKLQEAEKLFQQINKAQPDNPLVVDLKAALALAQKKPQQAVEIYSEARTRFPQSNRWSLRMAQLQWQIGERENSTATLEEWLKGHPDDDQVRFVLAGNEMLVNHGEKAKANFAILHEKFPKNVNVLNNLAWLTRNENPKLAYDYAKSALELAPQDAAVMDTLGMILLDMGQTEEGLHFISKAADKLPKSEAIQFHLAQGLVRKGDQSEAREILKKLLSDDHPFTEREQAHTLLKELGD